MPKKAKQKDEGKIVLNSSTKKDVEEVLEDIKHLEIGEELIPIENALQSLDPKSSGKSYRPVKTLLESAWNFFEALRLVREKGDYLKAEKLFKLAEEGFEAVEAEDIKHLAYAFESYSMFVLNAQRGNLSQCLELHKNMKMYLEKAGKFRNKYTAVIEICEPEFFYIASTKSLAELDFTNAKISSEKARQLSIDVANKYFEEGTPLYYKFLGAGHLYKAIYTFHRALNDLNLFEFRKLSGDSKLLLEAEKAEEMLEKADVESFNTKILLLMSKALIQLFEVMKEISNSMQKVFNSTFKPNLQDLDKLRNKISTARDYYSEVGATAAPYVRFCEQLTSKVNNLERLVRPGKRISVRFLEL